MTDADWSAADRLARIGAALDQATASLRRSRSPQSVTLGAPEWVALIEAVTARPRPPGLVRIPRGDAQGLTLAEVAADESGRDWLEWAVTRPDGYWPAVFREALDTFLERRGVV